MKSFFKEIFEYHHHFNLKFIEQVTENLNQLPERVVPLLSHNQNAHLCWNTRILYQDMPNMPEAYSLAELITLENKNYKTTVEILDSHELEEIVAYSNSKGDSYKNSIRDIFYHVANHHTHHRGQVISDIRESGIAPVPSDYIFHKR